MLQKIVGILVAASIISWIPAHAQPDLVSFVTSITPSPVTAGSSISIGWKVTNQGTSVAVASGLKIYLSSNSTFDASDTYLTPVVNVSNINASDSTSGTTSRTVPAGTAPGTWYILAQADAFNGVPESDNENNVSSPRSFTVSSCGSPGAFNLSSPLNSSSQPSATTSLSLMWSTSAGASSYDVYFGPTSNPAFLANQTGTSRVVNVAAGATYFWKVVAKSSCGQAAAPASGTWSFSVAAPPTCSNPGTFSLTSPSNGASFPSSTTSVSLTWGAASGAGSYDLHFGPGANLNFLVNQSGTSRTVNVSAGQTYSWKVIAKDSCGQPASSPGPWSFSIAQSSGSLIVTVQDQAGSPRSGAKVVRYPHGSETALDTVTTDEVGKTPAYINVPPGTSYDFEAYYEGANPFDTQGELWATAAATMTSGANSLTLRRDWPYVESLRIFRVADNVELASSAQIAPGEGLRLEAVVRNRTSTDKSVFLRFLLDRNEISAWDNDATTLPTVVPANRSQAVTAILTPTQLGTYSKAVRAETVPGGKTDAWDWGSTFVVYAPSVTNEFFDDFLYTGSNDQGLAQSIWTLVNGVSGPPKAARYDKANLSFANGVLSLTAKTGATLGSMSLARLETSRLKFLRGTYAARVWFSDDAVASSDANADRGDGNVQTFYAINQYGDEDNRYSECDFEYLPWDAFGSPEDRSTKMYSVTWERTGGYTPDYRFPTPVSRSFAGGWRTLEFQVDDQEVRYFIDDTPIDTHIQPYVPESPMQIALGNWVANQSQVSPSVGSGTRSYVMQVDWVYHAQNQFLSPSDLRARVGFLRVNTVQSKDTIPEVFPTPEALSFGSVAVGLFAERVFTIQNAGGGVLTGTATAGASFEVVGGAYYNLAAGESQAVTVRFTPSAVQAYSGVITFPGAAGATMEVTGTGTTDSLPVLSLTPSVRDFGTLPINSITDLSFTVQNTGGSTLSGSASVPAPFSIVSGSPYNLTAGQSVNVFVRFAPTSAQSSAATVSFSGASGATASVSGTGTNSPLPSDPSWLRVTVASQTQLNLQWDDNATNENGFKVERKDGCCGPWNEIATLPANSTTYQSTGLACNNSYAYRVWAFNSTGNSGKTNEANNTTSACSQGTLPTPDPSWLRVTAVSPTQINLQWDDNSPNEDGFKVERKQGCCGPWVEIATLPANSTTYQSTGLTCSGSYAYRVWAFNTTGDSGKTNETAATPGC